MSLLNILFFSFENVEEFFNSNNVVFSKKEVLKGYKYFIEEYVEDVKS